MQQTSLSKFWAGKTQKETVPAADEPASERKKVAEETLGAIQQGYYDLPAGLSFDLSVAVARSKEATKYYDPNSAVLSSWSTCNISHCAETRIRFFEMSSLEGARFLSMSSPQAKIGILNFASAKKEGGGFLRGAQAQEESLARSSTLYPTLMTTVAQQFYTLHKSSLNNGFYTHAMIYSPGCICFRDDDGGWLHPLTVDILTSPAVNAKEVRKELGSKVASNLLEENIEKEMKERMARILCLFEKMGVGHLVLGSFGTGVFKNKIEMVARLWAELLASRFNNVFSHIVFAILGDRTFTEFRQVFTAEYQ